MYRRTFLATGGALALTACAAPVPQRDVPSPEVVARAAYRHPGPSALTLFTMVNNKSGAGAHTSLMINASQRVIFDPAGSVRHETIPEVNDVLYGITPRIADFYARAHARTTFHCVIQRREVSADVAEQAFALARQRGPVAQAQCALVTSGILRELPGFTTIRQTWFPNQLAEQFGQLSGVETRTLYEDDADDKTVAIAEFDAAQRAAQTR